MTEFEQFWSVFPRKVGKLGAQRAYKKARTQASAEVILAGIQTYLLNKPTYADICFPSTYLNQGRWLDEATPISAPSPTPWVCAHQPHCGSAWRCDQLLKLAEAKARR